MRQSDTAEYQSKDPQDPEGDLPSRQCARCRKLFAADPSIADDPQALAEWWLCPPCHESLLG